MDKKLPKLELRLSDSFDIRIVSRKKLLIVFGFSSDRGDGAVQKVEGGWAAGGWG